MPKASKKTPVFSIFIPTGGRASSLERELKSLCKQSFTDFELLIVDYKSGDEVFRMLKKYQQKLQMTVIHQTIKGLSKAANLALKEARGKYFIRTDDDVEMTPKWLESIYETFQSDKKIGGVTGPTVVPETNIDNRDVFTLSKKSDQGSSFWQLIGKVHTQFFLDGQPMRVSHWFDSGAFSLGTNYASALKQPRQEVNNLEACNYAVQTRLLKKIGGFDQVYAGVGEYHEPDAAFKIMNLGYTLVFDPKAVLHHMPSQEGFYNDRPASYTRIINFIVFYMRHIRPNTFRKILRFTLYILFQDAYYVYQAMTRRQLNQLGALIGSIMGFVIYYQTKNTQ